MVANSMTVVQFPAGQVGILFQLQANRKESGVGTIVVQRADHLGGVIHVGAVIVGDGQNTAVAVIGLLGSFLVHLGTEIRVRQNGGHQLPMVNQRRLQRRGQGQTSGRGQKRHGAQRFHRA